MDKVPERAKSLPRIRKAKRRLNFDRPAQSVRLFGFVSWRSYVSGAWSGLDSPFVGSDRQQRIDALHFDAIARSQRFVDRAGQSHE
jgi:hypothetical protein